MKKRTLLFIAALVSACTSFAQNQGIGIHFGTYDFYGPQTDNYFLVDKNRVRFEDDSARTTSHKTLLWTPLVKLTYWRQLNKHIDVSAALSLSNIQYPVSDKDSNYINRRLYDRGIREEHILIELDARVNYNIIPKEDWILSPYLFAGINGSYHNYFFGADIPLGVGLNVNLSKSDNLFLNIESGYKIAATSNDQNHLQHSVGFVYWFKGGYHDPKPASNIEVPPPPVVLDSDDDGVVDSLDQCPTIAGLEQFNGCPDTDGDGISDKDDACPLVAGLAQFNGCPDSDGDGISDKDDKCPYVAGIAARQGCPVPDKDGDGFNDDEDRCPEVYSKTNGGCPEIRQEVIRQVEKAAKAIFFETGKATLKKTSFKSLDAVVSILKSDATLYADIEGHTDNVGDDAMNMTLSENRAASVRDYFVSKGIDSSRLTSHGFGETQPVADNATAAGKAQNRRTVIKLRNFAR